jgi:hypothetical protein
MAVQERQFLRQHFLAPVARGQKVRVRIAGIICTMQIEPQDFEGFGVFVPIDHACAMLDRDATLAERRRYLELLPTVRMIVSQSHDALICAVPADRSDARFRADGMLPVHLADEAGLFDTLIARFDGSQLWFDQVDPGADVSIAPYLRESLTKMLDPGKLDRPGISEAHQRCYAQIRAARLARMEFDYRQRQESRLRDALSHAGAALRDFVEAPSHYRVTFEFDGRRHTSVIGRNDLTVQSAGICLSGLDSNFDLTSLVGVLREGMR